MLISNDHLFRISTNDNICVMGDNNYLSFMPPCALIQLLR